MRTQRHSAVQTKEQYELVHRAISQLFEKQLQLLESPTNSEIHGGMVRTTPTLLPHTQHYSSSEPHNAMVSISLHNISLFYITTHSYITALPHITLHYSTTTYNIALMHYHI
uniref:protein-tyrosine-phosphatase n=1 Tax=Hucho hucho TaxID=62062 RepID=A0A4W5LC92_9TELE